MSLILDNGRIAENTRRNHLFIPSPTSYFPAFHPYHLRAQVHFFVEEIVVELDVSDELVELDDLVELEVVVEVMIDPSAA